MASRRGPPPPPPQMRNAGGVPTFMASSSSSSTTPIASPSPHPNFFTPVTAASPFIPYENDGDQMAMHAAREVMEQIGELPQGSSSSIPLLGSSSSSRTPSQHQQLQQSQNLTSSSSSSSSMSTPSITAGGEVGDEFPPPSSIRSGSTPAPHFSEPQFGGPSSSTSSTPLLGEAQHFYDGDPLRSLVTPNIAAFPDGIVPEVQNVVSTVDVKAKLNLEYIAANTRNSEYNPRRFAAVIMRIREPKTTALIFSSGKIVCTGARSEFQSKIAARKYARILEKLGNQVKFTRFKVQNVVASCDVRFPIRLDRLAEDHDKFATYEPEVFPGLVYKIVDPKVSLLIFVSGKVVLTGAKTREDIYRAFCAIWPTLFKYKKQPVQM